jgi:hypothetical protein
MTILQNNDIFKFVGLDNTFSVCSEDIRKRIEISEFSTRLGSSFYTHLLDHLADYSVYTAYTSSTTYAIDDVVQYEGDLYVAKEEVTGIAPSNVSKWKVAPLFKQEEGFCDYNDFYCSYLGPFLAHAVLIDRLPLLKAQITNDGIIEVNNDGFKSVSSASYEKLDVKLTADVQLTYKLLVDYMKENNGDGCYDLFMNIETTTCDTEADDYIDDDNDYNIA